MSNAQSSAQVNETGGTIETSEAAKPKMSALVPFMMNPLFEETYLQALGGPSRNRQAGEELLNSILGPMPESASRARKAKAPSGLTGYMASLYEVPLLNREQEFHLFRKMNCLLFLAARTRQLVELVFEQEQEQLQERQLQDQEQDDGGEEKEQTESDRLRELYESLLESAISVSKELTRRNLRLVVSIAKKFCQPTAPLQELVSDGNLSLVRAVSKFDFSRGNKFSTYASWAIMKNFMRSVPQEAKNRQRCRTGEDVLLQFVADDRDTGPDEAERDRTSGRLRDWMREVLSDREFNVIAHRYGLFEYEGLTLELLGAKMGITKERVRQIQSRAQRKLESHRPADLEP